MRAFVTVTAILGLSLSFAGCAKRIPFSPKELTRVQDATAEGVDALRVFPSKKLILISKLKGKDEAYDVEKTIKEASNTELLKEVIKPNTPGLVLEAGERNGAPELFVTFDPSCSDRECAFGFVQTEDGVFRLSSAPAREGYSEPKVYWGRVRDKRRMKLGKHSSLKERNEVFLNKSKRGKVRSIELVVRKKVDDSKKTKVKRSRGID